jgi:hypothetical protein
VDQAGSGLAKTAKWGYIYIVSDLFWINQGENSMNEYFTETQKENLQYFQNNLADFLKNPIYKHKFAIIADKKIAGIFDTFNNAIEEAVSSFTQGEYVIQQIIGEDEVINFLYPAIA